MWIVWTIAAGGVLYLLLSTKSTKITKSGGPGGPEPKRIIDDMVNRGIDTLSSLSEAARLKIAAQLFDPGRLKAASQKVVLDAAQVSRLEMAMGRRGLFYTYTLHGQLYLTRDRDEAERGWDHEVTLLFRNRPGARRVNDKIVYKAAYPYDPDRAIALAGRVSENVSSYLGFSTPELIAAFQDAAGIRNRQGISDGLYDVITQAALNHFGVAKPPAPIAKPIDARYDIEYVKYQIP